MAPAAPQFLVCPVQYASGAVCRKAATRAEQYRRRTSRSVARHLLERQVNAEHNAWPIQQSLEARRCEMIRTSQKVALLFGVISAACVAVVAANARAATPIHLPRTANAPRAFTTAWHGVSALPVPTPIPANRSARWTAPKNRVAGIPIPIPRPNTRSRRFVAASGGVSATPIHLPNTVRRSPRLPSSRAGISATPIHLPRPVVSPRGFLSRSPRSRGRQAPHLYRGPAGSPDRVCRRSGGLGAVTPLTLTDCCGCSRANHTSQVV
jgi:hypothetical protein